jgi:hypothetical protein
MFVRGARGDFSPEIEPKLLSGNVLQKGNSAENC